MDLYYIMSWFFIFSFLGWLWETSFVSIRNKKYVNRGFVSGPFCTIYGAGAVSVYLILKPLSGNYLAIFFVGMLVATVLEYVTSVVMEGLFHAKWWDYSNQKFNVKGRICLGASIGWGFMSLALFLFLMPAVQWIVNLIPYRIGEILLSICSAFYVIDFSLAASAAFNLRYRLQQMQRILDEMGERMRMSKPVEKIVDVVDELEERPTYAQFRKKLEAAKLEFIKNQDRISRRFMTSYPKLSESMILRKEEFEKFTEEIKNKFEKK